MNIGKIFTLLCAMILSVCLVFAISSLTVLRNAVAETDRVRQETEQMLAVYQKSEETAAIPVQADPLKDQPSETPPAAEPQGFCLREERGKVGIFTSDNHLIALTDISVDLLPLSDQELLRAGIRLDSWSDLRSALDDFGG